MYSLTGTLLKIGATADTSDAHDHTGFLAPDPYLTTHQVSSISWCQTWNTHRHGNELCRQGVRGKISKPQLIPQRELKKKAEISLLKEFPAAAMLGKKTAAEILRTSKPNAKETVMLKRKPSGSNACVSRLNR